MKILYLGVEYDRLDPKRGHSFEHQNFYKVLRGVLGCEVVYLPLERAANVDRRRFNKELVETVKREKPDLFFCFMYSDELELAALETLKNKTMTLAWFADDHWRFWNYSRRYAPHFSWVATTYSKAPELYRRIGVRNVIRSQWGANTALYKLGGLPFRQDIDVSFIGGWSRPRARLISFLRRQGIKINVYGRGWARIHLKNLFTKAGFEMGSDGRVSFEEMIAIFQRSKINLALNIAPGFLNKNSLGRLFLRASGKRVVPDLHIVQNLQSWLHRGIRQIKARHFEIPACGGFVITEPADDIDCYYAPDKEMVFYRSASELADKIRYYLAHEEERLCVARAGYERTLQEHTYEERFKDIFQTIGLS